MWSQREACVSKSDSEIGVTNDDDVDKEKKKKKTTTTLTHCTDNQISIYI